MKILVSVFTPDRYRCYTENVTIYVTDYWETITADKVFADQNEEDAVYSKWTRSIKCPINILTQFNGGDNDHFIFGWYESFSQGENFTPWMMEENNLQIEVQNIY